MKRHLIILMLLVLAAGLIIVPVSAQAAFSLTHPTGTVLVRDFSADLASFQWEALSGAIGYELSLFKVSTNVKDTPLGEVFTVAVPTANCNATHCGYAPTGPQYALIDRGQYAWTVFASTGGGDVEASNAPLFFSYEPNPIPLVQNPGFETGGLAPWVGSGLAGDKVKDGNASSGLYAFKFKGGPDENAKIKQKYDVTYYGIDTTDTLTLTADYKTNNAAVNGSVVVKLGYVNPALDAEKVTLPFSFNTDYTTVATNLIPDGWVKKAKVQVKHQSTSGKVFVDDVQLTLQAVGPRGVLPVPQSAQ